MPRKKRTKRSTEKPPGKGRYPSVTKPTYYGITFDSKREALHYLDLRDRQNQGIIRDLRTQVRIAIVIGGVAVRYPNGRQMVYIADFTYYDIALGEHMTVDAKGHATDVYKLKRALLHTMGVTITEV